MDKILAWAASKKVFKGDDLTLWFEDREQRDDFVSRDPKARKAGCKWIAEDDPQLIKKDLVPTAPESEERNENIHVSEPVDRG